MRRAGGDGAVLIERIPLANGLVLLIGTEQGMVNPPPEFVRPRIKAQPDVTPTLLHSELPAVANPPEGAGSPPRVHGAPSTAAGSTQRGVTTEPAAHFER